MLLGSGLSCVEYVQVADLTHVPPNLLEQAELQTSNGSEIGEAFKTHSFHERGISVRKRYTAAGRPVTILFF